MAEIALIRPPSLLPAVVFSATPGVPPIGIAYLAGSLKAAKHRVRIIDSFGEAPDKRTLIGIKDLMITGLDADDIVARIPNAVSAIGITCMFSNDWLYVKILMRHIKEKFPLVPIIVGGEHVTGDPEYALYSAPDADIVVLGEGEETLVELISIIEAEGSWKKVHGIAFRDEAGKVVVNPLRPRVKNLEALPWPDWEAVPLETYLSRGLGHGSSGGRIMPILASRGCPFRCAFCTNPVTWQSKWVARLPGSVIEEMAYYIKRYRITQFEFADLTIIVRKDWIMDFCRLFMSRNLKVAWSLPFGTRAEALDEEVLSTMFKAGCKFFSYAPESGSLKTLARIHKQADPAKMLASMKTAVRVGFDVKSNIVFGFPGQTLGEVLVTFWYIIKMAFIGIHDVPVFPFTPYPGTELFNQLVREGKIRRDEPGYDLWLSYNVYNTPSSIRSWSEHIPNWMMKPLTIGGMGFFYTLQFIFRPWRLITMLNRLIRRKPRTFLDRALQEILTNFVFEKKRRLKLKPPNKDISKNDFRAWNEEMAAKYNPDDFHNSKNIFIRWIEGMRVKRIIQSAAAYKGRKVLEVGCGTGNILERIPFDKVYGIDISDSLLKRAKTRLDGRAYLTLGNGEKMPFREGGFDMVICTEVIEHTYSPQALLENISRVLNSKGKLIISIPNEGLINFLKKLYFGILIFLRHSPDNGSGYKIARKMDDEWHLHNFEIAGFVKLLEKYFEVKQVCRIPHYFLPIRYLISCVKRMPAD